MEYSFSPIFKQLIDFKRVLSPFLKHLKKKSIAIYISESAKISAAKSLNEMYKIIPFVSHSCEPRRIETVLWDLNAETCQYY